MIEVNSETDFVAKNDTFKAFVKGVLETVLANKPADVDALLHCTIAGGSETVEAALQDKILTIGENMKIRRFERLTGDLVAYVHGGGRIGVMVQFDTNVYDNPDFNAFAKDIAMQVAASVPQYLDKDSVPADVLEKEKEILTVQAMNEGKPEAIAQKMVMGRINKFYKEVCLTEQPFIKDGDITVAKYIANTAKEFGGEIKLTRFVRFEKGEGIEKREENFADEVASMMKK